jgi:hypothetical protein
MRVLLENSVLRTNKVIYSTKAVYGNTLVRDALGIFQQCEYIIIQSVSD